MSKPLSTEFQFGAGVGEAGPDTDLLDLDGVAAFQDLVAAEYAVGGQVDEPLFAGFQFGELLAELVVQLTGELLLVGHGGVELLADGGGKVVGDAQSGVVRLDGFFDLPARQVRQVAVALLP